MKKLISYIFPVYNEELNLDKLYGELMPVLKTLEYKYEFEIICINDGSKDKSLEKLLELRKKDKRFKIINFSRNFGHQIAVTAGLDYSGGDAVIIMDSDLQDPPSVSLNLIKKWEKGFEVVYAQRKSRKDTIFKKITAFLFYRTLKKFAEIDIPKDTGDFRLIDKKVVKALSKFRERNRFLRGLVSYVGFKQTAVLFDRNKRYKGKTGYSLKKMINFAIDGITSFSFSPLNLILQIGGFLTLTFISLIFIYIFIALLDPTIPVNSTILFMFAIGFFSGLQIFFLGITSLYIGRIYSEVQNRPLYIISDYYGDKKNTKDT